MTAIDSTACGGTLNFEVQNAVSNALGTAMTSNCEKFKGLMKNKFDELEAWTWLS